MESEEERIARQERLAEELDQRLSGIYQDLSDILDIIENEEEGGDLCLELESIRDSVIRTINSSVA